MISSQPILLHDIELCQFLFASLAIGDTNGTLSRYAQSIADDEVQGSGHR
ncbi:MAG: hypothetical protein SOH81_07410 [Acetobacter sp.]